MKLVIHKALLFVILLLVCTNLYSITADELIEKSYKAMNSQDKSKIKTWKFNTIVSNMLANKSSVNTTYYFKGDNERVEQTVGKDVFIFGRNKGKFWFKSTNKAIDEEKVPIALKQMYMDMGENQKKTMIYGPFFDYKARFKSTQLLKDEKINGKDYFKLKAVTKKNVELVYFIDKQTFLVSLIETKAISSNNVQIIKVGFPSYIKKDNYMFVSAIEQYMGNSIVSKIDIKDVVYNIPIKDSQFKK